MSKAPKFYIYTRTTGGIYLTQRAVGNGYRWIKNRDMAAMFSNITTAKRAARRYSGSVVRV